METRGLSPELVEQVQYIKGRLHIPQATIAERAGVAQGTVSNCLRGVVVRSDYLIRIVDAEIEMAEKALETSELDEEIAAELRCHLRDLARAVRSPPEDEKISASMLRIKDIEADIESAAATMVAAAIKVAEAAAAEARIVADRAAANPTPETVGAAAAAVAAARAAALAAAGIVAK